MPTLREYFPNAAQPPAHRDGEKLKRMDAALEAELAAAGIDASVVADTRPPEGVE